MDNSQLYFFFQMDFWIFILLCCISQVFTSQSGWSSDIQTAESRSLISEMKVKNIQDILLLPPEEPQLVRRPQRTYRQPSNEYTPQEYGSLSSYAEHPNYGYRPYQHVSDVAYQEQRPYQTQKQLPNQAYKTYEVPGPPEDIYHNTHYQNAGHHDAFQDSGSSKTNKKIYTTRYIVQQTHQNTPTNTKAETVHSSSVPIIRTGGGNINAYNTRSAVAGVNTKQSVIVSQPELAVQHAVGTGQQGNVDQTFPTVSLHHMDETLRVLAHLQALKAAQPLSLNPYAALLLASSIRKHQHLPFTPTII